MLRPVEHVRLQEEQRALASLSAEITGIGKVRIHRRTFARAERKWDQRGSHPTWHWSAGAGRQTGGSARSQGGGIGLHLARRLVKSHKDRSLPGIRAADAAACSRYNSPGPISPPNRQIGRVAQAVWDQFRPKLRGAMISRDYPVCAKAPT